MESAPLERVKPYRASKPIPKSSKLAGSGADVGVTVKSMLVAAPVVFK